MDTLFAYDDASLIRTYHEAHEGHEEEGTTEAAFQCHERLARSGGLAQKRSRIPHGLNRRPARTGETPVSRMNDSERQHFLLLLRVLRALRGFVVSPNA